MAQVDPPNSDAIRLTNGDTKSMLEGLLYGGFHPIHASLFSSLGYNDEIKALTLTSKKLNISLTKQTNQGLGTDLNQALQTNLVRRCEEGNYPMVMPVPGGGPCRGRRDSAIIQTCGSSDAQAQYLKNMIHGTGPRPKICSTCRDTNHFGPRPPNGTEDDHYAWRNTIAWAHVPVCRRCDLQERKNAGPDGYDGCTCYETRYRRRHLCFNCSAYNWRRLQAEMSARRGKWQERRLWQENNQMVTNSPPHHPARQAPGNMPLCPCSERQYQQGPHIQPWQPPRTGRPVLGRLLPELMPHTPISRDFVGNQHLRTINPHGFHLKPIKLPFTMQCTLCCGYVVPPRRRSKRQKQKNKRESSRRHCMLDSKGVAVSGSQMNEHGFLQ